MKSYWGIDLGGTKIEGIVLSAPSPEAVLIRKRVDTEAHLGYEHIIGQVKMLIDMLKSETGLQPERIGFSTPGTHDPTTQNMKGCNTTCLNGMPFKDGLEAALGVPVRIANDANCFALAETTLGVVPELVDDFRSVFGVIMGTGVGGGVVFKAPNGEPFVLGGLQGIAGEWGHNIIETNGHPCYCGKSGCLEEVISGPALQRFYEQQSGQKRKLADIVQLHLSQTDLHATATIDRLLEYFGQAISTIINVLDPDVIVIGGGVGNIDLLYTEGIERVKKYIFNLGQVNTKIVKPKLGDSAGVFGAAMLQ